MHHAFRELAQRNVAGAHEVHTLEQFTHPASPLRRPQAKKLARIVQELLGRQVVVEVGILGKVPDAGVQRNVIHLASQDACCARGRENQPEKDLERRTLAGPVRAQQPKYLGSFNAKVQPVERPLRPLAPESHGVVFGKSDGLESEHKR